MGGSISWSQFSYRLVHFWRGDGEKLRNGYAKYLHTALIVLDLCWHIPEDSHIRSYQLYFCTVLGMYTCLSCIHFHLYQNKV